MSKMSDMVSNPSSIAIRAETSIADPDSCKFTVSRMIHPGGPFFFDSPERATGSPLVERLFALAGVAYVLVAGNVVTIGKKESASWDRMRSEVGTVIRTQLTTGVRAILEAPWPSPPGNRNDDEIREVVQDLLDQETNPSIASHGGKISIVEVKDRNLYINMSGGCQGCAASQVTLRQGFELMVRRVAPEIVDIIDATDHASGTSPFYKHANA
jgi:Fe-S cluster biogenesis protein NfuA